MATDSGQVPAANLPDVTPEVQRALTACTVQLLGRHDVVVHEFHRQLLSAAPAVMEMAGEGRPMCERTVLAALQNTQPAQRTAAVATAVSRVGRENYLDGFPEAHIGTITHALLHAIRTVYTGEWAVSLSSGWAQYLMWFQAHLQHGARGQRAQDMANGHYGAYHPTDPVRGVNPDSYPAYGHHSTPATGPGDLHRPEGVVDDRRKTRAGRRSEASRPTSVDRVVVNHGGAQRTLTAAQWKALPLAAKAKYLRLDPKFYAGTQQIDAKEAIAALRG